MALDIGGLEIIKKLGLKPKDFAFSKYVISRERSLIFAKSASNNQIITDFNAGFKTIITNGTYKSIVEKYYGSGKVPASVMNLTNKW